MSYPSSVYTFESLAEETSKHIYYPLPGA